MPISIKQRHINSPQIVEGWNLVETESALAFPALIRHLESENKKILWIDSSNQAQTHYFESRPELLEKIYIARAFTALQHHQLCKNIGEYDLIVIPEIDRLYEKSSLYRTEAVQLFEDMIEGLDGKILYSVSGEIGFKAKKKCCNEIEVEQTSEGLKFSQNNRQTQVYTDSNGFQTTIPFYREVKDRWEKQIKLTETGLKN